MARTYARLLQPIDRPISSASGGMRRSTLAWQSDAPASSASVGSETGELKRGNRIIDPDSIVTMSLPVNEEMAFTGERFIPGTRGEIWVEHWHRYHFAAHWAAGREVLDVACGEGYGTALLAARGAKRVTGVDLSAQAVAHARTAYANLANAQFVEAPCTRMPFPDA